MESMPEELQESRIEKSHFKLPRTQAADLKGGIRSHPESRGSPPASADFGTHEEEGVNLTGDDRESREMTEADENVL